MNSFGTFLKEQREKRGIRLEEIASITKIHLHNLELMEAGEFAKLPPEPFIRGFITAYAKYIGLDPKEAVTRYDSESHPHETVTTLDSVESTEEVAIAPAKTQFGFGFGALVVASIAVVAAIIIWGRTPETAGHKESSAVANIPIPTPTVVVPNSTTTAAKIDEKAIAPIPLEKVAPPPKAPEKLATTELVKPPAKVETKIETPVVVAEVKKAEKVEAPVTAPVVPPTVPAGKTAHTLEVTAKERTWIRITKDSNNSVETFLAPGETKVFTADEKIRLMLGNSTGTVVKHNGEVDEGTKFDGTIRTYTHPQNAKFAADAKAKPRSTAGDTSKPAKKPEKGKSKDSADTTDPENLREPASESGNSKSRVSPL